MNRDKLKEVARHLRGDIRGFKKEANEDRDLLKRLRSSRSKSKKRKYDSDDASIVAKKLKEDPRGFQRKTSADYRLERKTRDPMKRDYREEEGNEDEYEEEKEEFARMQKSSRTREPLGAPRKIDYPDYPQYSGTNMTRDDIEDEEKEAHMKSLSKEKRKAMMSRFVKKNMQKYGSKWIKSE